MAYDEDVVAKILQAIPFTNLPKNHMTCFWGITKNSRKMAATETILAKSKQPFPLQDGCVQSRRRLKKKANLPKLIAEERVKAGTKD